MKKILMFLGLAAMVAVSCQEKEFEYPTPEKGVSYVFEGTVATDGLLLVHVMSRFVAFNGFIFEVNVSVAPIAKLKLLLFKIIPFITIIISGLFLIFASLLIIYT